jgi:nicotinamidase-related amidase
MFPFDPSLLPQLPTRKALIAIDFQADFFPPPDSTIAGAYKPKLPIVHPASPGILVGRVIELAHRFRASGNVVCWVESAYHGARPAEKELPKPPGIAAGTDENGRDADIRHDKKINEDANRDGESNNNQDGINPGGEEVGESDPYPDAFLSPGPAQRPLCVQPSTPGASLHPLIERTLASYPRDLCITKTHYSAFKCPAFLQRLRVSFVTELFVCGSITNAGVYATAIEAAGHGYAITLIDDCCGCTDQRRRDAAVMSSRRLQEHPSIH